MSPISAVGKTELELDHMIARVAMPGTTRLPDRSSGDRAPQTPEKSRRQRSANLPRGKREAGEEEPFEEESPPPEPPPPEAAPLYSPSRKAGTSYSKDQPQHNVDFRA